MRKGSKVSAEDGRLYGVLVEVFEVLRAAPGATLKCSLIYSASLEKEQRKEVADPS